LCVQGEFHEQSKDHHTPSIQWLLLPGEKRNLYTNWGDGRKGDASKFIARVNRTPDFGLGHSDWRLPTIVELLSLIDTVDAPKRGVYWSMTPRRNSNDAGLGVDFDEKCVDHYPRGSDTHVRLVRVNQ
jgi:hypothetical protein